MSCSESFDLYFNDLTREAQKEILSVAGLNSPEEANWDVFPITTIDFEQPE